MDPIAMMLGLLLLGTGAAAGWLLIGRARLLAAAAEADVRGAAGLAEAARARQEREAERSRLEAQVEGLRRRGEEWADQVRDLEVQGMRVREQLRAEQELHGSEMAKHEELFRGRVKALEEQKATLEGTFRERIGELNKKFEDTFRSLATEALKSSREDFFRLAQKTFEVEREKAQAEMEKRRAAVDELVKPIAETLKKTDEKLSLMEKERTSAYAGLVEQVKGMADVGNQLRSETGRLVRALSKPDVRGRYGEIQLRRVAELAGMTGYCDFCEQESQRDGDGRLLRPDMVVRLPNDRLIAVDAKTNTGAYLEAADARTPREQEECLDRFADAVVDQVSALASKRYWAEFPDSPEFVVMFVPGDQFLDAALARRPDLLDRAAERQVIIASPSTLIGLLRAVAVGWREKRIEDQAKELFRLGRELHERAAVAYGYVARLGSALEQAVSRYNEFVGSYQSRLEPTLRRFEEAGARSGRELGEVGEITVRARVVDTAANDGELLLSHLRDA